MTKLRHILPSSTLQEMPIGGEIKLNILPEQANSLRQASYKLRRQGVGMWDIRKCGDLIFVQRYF
jgi:hypothetical protein